MIGPTTKQRRQWDEDGFVVVEDAIKGEELKWLQSAFDRCARDAKSDWLEGVGEGTRSAAYFDIPNAFEKDDVFIDIVDHPSYYGLLMDFTDGEVVLIGPQVRTLPFGPTSYSWWHPDVPQTKTLHIKLQIYVDDVGPDDGVFSYIPGSHKKDAGPFPTVRWLENMPGHHLLPGKAGTAIIFNCYGWHTAMVNRSQKQRRSIILCYATTKEDMEMNAYASISDRLTTPERKKLFRMEN
ncbi:MAG TPA: hypothetical protein DIU35_15450 [Candidatus Latescibacteria bacterium]|nr:hypothetical protein [Candidatus Latescibacterota bacterium]